MRANGQPARMLRLRGDRAFEVLTIEVADIQTVRIVRNPDKLAHL